MGTITAVEWLIQELKEQIRKSAHNELDTKRTGDYRIGLTKAIEFCEQAKEIEKQQIKECWRKAQEEQRKEFSSAYCSISADKYYNETFNTK